MNLTQKIRTFQFTTTGVRISGMIFLLASVLGVMLQNVLLGTSGMTNSQLLEYMQQDSSVMMNVSMAVAFQVFGTCAIPIFSFLLVEGASHTSHYGKYFARVLGLAVVSQFPYNLLVNRNVFLMTRLNPAFAMVLCLAMIYFFRRYSEKKAGNVVLKILAIFGVYLWSNMLGVEHGAVCVILTAVLWGLRGKTNMQTLVGILVMLSCSIFSMYYIAAALAFMVLHFYEGEQGNENKLVNYLAYPVILLIFGVLGIVL